MIIYGVMAGVGATDGTSGVRDEINVMLEVELGMRQM